MWVMQPVLPPATLKAFVISEVLEDTLGQMFRKPLHRYTLVQVHQR
jgi:hypothetical protein